MQRGKVSPSLYFPRYKDAFVGTTPLPSSTVVAVADLTVLSCEWAGGTLSLVYGNVPLLLLLLLLRLKCMCLPPSSEEWLLVWLGKRGGRWPPDFDDGPSILTPPSLEPRLT